jgi:UDP-glucose 4-epimerase
MGSIVFIYESYFLGAELNRYLLIGSSGFIGKAFSKTLLNNGFPSINIESRSQTEKLLATPGILMNIDRVVWAASKVNPVTAELHPDWCSEEFNFFTQFITCLRSTANLNVHLTFLSSAGCIYSGDDENFSETSVAIGTNAYGKLKRRMELALEESGLSHSILRISNVYGPGQPVGRGQGVIAEWINAINLGRPVRVFGNLGSTRDYIYLDDLTNAMLSTSDNKLQGIFNVGSGQSIELRELIRVLASVASKDLEIDYQDARSTDRIHFSLNISKIRTSSSWFPEISLETGIQSSLDSAKRLQLEGFEP